MTLSPLRSYLKQGLTAIVGIAADARDAEQVSTLVRDLSRECDVSFLVLPCASNSSDAPSLLARLRSASSLPVLEATTGTVLRSHRVYVAPTGASVSVEDLRLHVSPGVDPSAVDACFTSLAADQGERAVGLMLSLETSHAESGLRALAHAGGCALAYERANDRFDDASNHGRPVDDVSARLLGHLARLRERDNEEPATKRRPRRVSGTHALRTAEPPAAPLIQSLTRTTPRDSPDHSIVGANVPFFRPDLYQGLAAHLQVLIAARPNGRLRVWVPCCRTGQDAYSIGMLLAQREARTPDEAAPLIFATDSDPLAVGVARDARYPEAALSTLGPDLRRRFFIAGYGSARIKGWLRHQLAFTVHDVFYSPPLSRVDLLLGHEALRTCPRHLMDRLLARFHFALRKGGWLFVGADQQAQIPPHLFERLDERSGLFRARTLRTDVLRAHQKLIQASPSADRVELDALADELKGLSTQRLEELERLDRAHADLKNFIEATGIIACICDAKLAIRRASPSLGRFRGFTAIEPGLRLGDIADRLPGGAQLLAWGESVQRTGVPIERTEQTWFDHPQSFLVRVSPYQNERGSIDGVVFVFTDVTPLEEARALVTKRERQHAAVAAIGLAALSESADGSSTARALYERALDCVTDRFDSHCAFVLECGLGPAAFVVRAVCGPTDGLEDGTLVSLRDDDGLRVALAADAPVDLGKLPRIRPLRVRPHLKIGGGIACALRVEHAVHGILVVYTEGAHVDRDDLTFVQAVANVVAGAAGRQRARRRLALEREVGVAVSESEDIVTAMRRIEAALAAILGIQQLALWVSRDADQRPLAAAYPPEQASSGREQSSTPDLAGCAAEALAQGRTSWTVTAAEGKPPTTELAFPVLRGVHTVGVAVCRADSFVVVDEELLLALEHAGRAIAEFLQWTRMNAALRESEQIHRAQAAELETIYATLPVGLALFDKNLDEVRVNQRLVELRSAPDEPILTNEMLRNVLETGIPVRDLEVNTHSHSGSKSWLCGLTPLRDTQGQVIGVSSVVQDISERKHMERALVEADRQKDEFLAMLGHELRNPLAAIRSATELLQASSSAHPELDRVQGVLLRQTTQMAKLIDGLLDVSRIVRGKLVLDLSTVDLCQLAREVVQDQQAQLLRRRLDVELSLPEAPLWVQGDRVRLVQVIDNLLSNAIKFTSEEGRIEVRAYADSERALLEIEDNGIGIDAELLPHIFEPFRQAQQRSDRSLGGLGLGLSLVRGLVSLHGGSVRVANAGGEHGSVFSIELPLSHEAGQPTTLPPPRVESLNIVVVEDNQDMAEMLSELLTLSGHRVLSSAASAEEGIERVLRAQPDVVFCDLGLPGDLDGFDVARALRAKVGSTLALVALTGYGGPDYKARATKAGFDAILTKPVSFDVLQRQLARVMRRLARARN